MLHISPITPGREEALDRLEDLVYSKVLADRVLQPLLTERRPHPVDHLTEFNGDSLGRLERLTRFVALYLEALDEAGVPGDESFREAVRSCLEVGSHGTQQNLSRSHGKA